MHIAPAARMAADPQVLMRLLDRGRNMLRDRRAVEAILMFERAVTIPGAPAEAFGLLAEALLEGGRADEALQAADTALAAKDADGMLHLLRGRIRRVRGDAAGGMEDAAAAVMAHPSSGEAKTLLAICLSEADRHDEALFFFHQVLTSKPEDAHGNAMLAMAFMRAGEHEAAEELYARVESLAKNPRAVVVLRAQNAILAGEPERAIAMLEAAVLQADPGKECVIWAMLGQAYHRVGRDAQAATAYSQASALDPENGYLRHLAVALGAQPAMGDRASDQYVTEIFDGYATRFEKSLFALGYRTPGVMLQMIEAHHPGLAEGRVRLGDVLDLGCGTGLMGAALHDLLGGRLVGVDLSQRMLDAAGEKRIYTELRRAEIVAAMEQDETQYTLVVLADVLCYFGALERSFAAARARLAPGGVMLFSIEAGEPGTTWTLTGNARYQQSAEYVRAAMAQSGLVASEFREEVLRFENGEPVKGFIVLAALGH
ncbi:MAG: methyltransferase protein [Rubritepida sp.]|nr:methyltransferase protein [Rubritepida sp.]